MGVISKLKSLSRMTWFERILSLAPLAICIIWHRINRGYPYSDEGDYFEVTQKIYLDWAHRGFLAGLKSTYLTRTWKPILHPVLGVPAMLLTHGNVLASVAITLCGLYLVFLLYSFGLLKKFSSGRGAILGVWFVSTIPWVLVDFYSFNSEAPMITACVMVLYYLFSSKGIAESRNSVLLGLALALGFCIRPVEIFLVFLFPLLFCVWMRAKEGKISIRDFLYSLALLFGFSGLFLWEVRLEWRFDDRYCFLFLAGVILTAYLWKRKGNRGTFSSFFLAAYIPTVFWYAPFCNSLFLWVHGTTFTEYAKITGNRAGVPIIEFLSRVFYSLDGKPIAAVALLGVGGSLLSLRRLRWREDIKGCLLVLAIAVMTIAFPVLIGATTYNGATRYYQTVGIVAVFAVTYLLVTRTSGWSKVTAFLLVPPVVLNLAYVLLQISSASPEQKGRLNEYFGTSQSFLEPVSKEDPSIGIFRGIQRLIPREEQAHIEILRTLLPRLTRWSADPFKLSIISRERGYDWDFQEPWAYDGKSIEDHLKLATSSGKFLLVGTPDGFIDKVLPMSEVATFVMKDMSAIRMKKMGLSLVGEFNYEEMDGKSEVEYLFSTVL